MTEPQQSADQRTDLVGDARDEHAGAAPAAPIAPLWHTAALVVLIASVAIAGLVLSQAGHPPEAPAAAGRLGVYLPMVVVPWLLTFYVARVGRGAGTHRSLATLLGRCWDSPARAAADLALALACAGLIHASERLLGGAVDAEQAAAAAAVLPRTPVEHAGWLLVAVSVGFGEEVVYRGYLQTQLGALVGRPWLGVALQSALFGLAHLEQGLGAATRVAAYGLVFGVIARRRGSLLPAIAAHVIVDATSAWI